MNELAKLVLLLLLFIGTGICQNNTSLSNSSDPNCTLGIKLDNICCRDDCGELCGECTDSGLDLFCCVTDIVESNKTCNESLPPCILLDSEENEDYEMSLQRIIIISVSSSVAALFFIYICCMFRKKRPPLEYKEIVGKFD